MKVVVLQGLGEVISRKKLLEIKARFSENDILTVSSSVTDLELRTSLSTNSLFAENRLVILENPSESLSLEGTLDDSVTLVIWMNKDLDQRKTLFKSLKQINAEILNFPEAREISVFPFLDALADGKNSAFLELKKLNDAEYDTQYYLTMIFYLLRSLVVIPKNAPSFVKAKLERQRARFLEKDLKSLYKFALETDFKIKMGLLEPEQAQFLLVKEFMV